MSSPYRYRAVAFCRTTGRKLRDEVVTLTSEEIYHLQNEVGQLALYHLVNRWNRRALILTAGPINIYTVEP